VVVFHKLQSGLPGFLVTTPALHNAERNKKGCRGSEEEFGQHEGRGKNIGGSKGLAVEEFFEEEVGEALGVVADDAMFLEEIIENDTEAELLELGEIDGHWFGAL
jgi:hypothetical protein